MALHWNARVQSNKVQMIGIGWEVDRPTQSINQNDPSPFAQLRQSLVPVLFGMTMTMEVEHKYIGA